MLKSKMVVTLICPISFEHRKGYPKEFFYEDKEKTVINFGEKHTFTFFYDASVEGNFIVISEEEFFSP